MQSGGNIRTLCTESHGLSGQKETDNGVRLMWGCHERDYHLCIICQSEVNMYVQSDIETSNHWCGRITYSHNR